MVLDVKAPNQQELLCEFLNENWETLSTNKQALISAPVGGGVYREGIPEPKRAFLSDGVDDIFTSATSLATNSNSIYSFYFAINTSSASTQTIISNVDVSPTFQGFECGIVSGKLRFTIINDNSTTDRLTVDSVDSVNDGTWHLCLITYDGNELASGVNMYIDEGIVDNVASTTTTVHDALTTFTRTSQFYYLGRGLAATSLTFDGKIKDIRIWQSVVTPTTYETTATVRWYDCECNVGNIVFDRSGNGQHATISNHTANTFFYEGVDVPFSFQNSVGFSGINGISLNDGIDLGGGLTIRNGTPTISGNTVSATGTGSAIVRHDYGIKGRALEVNVKFTISNYVDGGVRIKTLSQSDVQLFESSAFSGNGSYEVTGLQIWSSGSQFNTVNEAYVSVFIGSGTFDVTIDEITLLGNTPRNEGNVTMDISGKELLHKGKIRQLAKITNVNVGSFDGASSYIDFGANHAGLEVNDFIVDFVVKNNGGNNTNFVAIQSDSSSSTNKSGWTLAVLTAGDLRFGYCDPNNNNAYIFNNITTLDVGEYHKIVIVKNGPSLKCYKDGQLESDITVDATINYNTNVTSKGNIIGSAWGQGAVTAGRYDGEIGGFRILSDVSKEDEVVNQTNTDTGIFCPTFNEGNGLTVFDISETAGVPNNNHGTWEGVTNPNQWGKSDEAIDYLFQRETYLYKAFDGVTYFSTGASYTFANANENILKLRIMFLSESFDQNLTDGNNQFRLGKSGSSSNVCEITRNLITIRPSAGATDSITFDTPLVDNTWYDIEIINAAASYDYTVKVDGVTQTDVITGVFIADLVHSTFGGSPLRPSNGILVEYIEFQNVTAATTRRIELNDFGYIEDNVQKSDLYKYFDSTYLKYSWFRGLLRDELLEAVLPTGYFKKIPKLELNKYHSNEFDIDFQYYKALPDTLPTDYKVSDIIPDNMAVDRYQQEVVSKILVGKSNNIKSLLRIQNYLKLSTLEKISSEYTWIKPENALLDGVTSRVTSVSDALLNTPYNFEGDSSSGSLIKIQNNKKSFGLTSEAVILRADSIDGGTWFTGSFSTFIPVKLLDGIPSGTGFLCHDQGASTNYRHWISVTNQGKIQVAFTINGTNYTALTQNAVFSNGPQNDFLGIFVTVDNSNQILIKSVDRSGTLTNYTLDATQDGDLTGVDLANYINSTNKFRVGVNSSSNLNNGGGYYGELLIQPVVWNDTQIQEIADVFYASSDYNPVKALIIGDSIANGSTDGTATADPETLFETTRTSGITGVNEVEDTNDTATGSPYPSMAAKFKDLLNRELLVTEVASPGAEFSPYLDNNNWSTTGTLYGNMELEADEYTTTHDTEYDFIFITLGINDVRGTTALSTIESDIDSLITRLRSKFGTSIPILINQLGRFEAAGYASDSRWLAVRGYIDDAIANYDNVYECADLINDYGGEASFHDGLHKDQESTNQWGEGVATFFVNNFIE